MDGRIKFKKNTNDMVYNPDHRIDTYYQICQFKNEFTGHFGVRKIVFNEQGTILKMFENEYSGKKIENFMKHHRQTKFKLYPTNDISHVELPNGNDMTEVQSELLNNNCKTYGNKRVDF